MDFAKINNEFLEFQKKLKTYEEQRVKLLEKLKKDEKEILKLENSFNKETDIIQKNYLQFLVLIKKNNYNELYDIVYSNNNGDVCNEK
ncbi:MAG TPA: hypothetical protein PLT65_00670 [Bacilli bacterium]|nr:hypothetical protein [Bacilli bacterium]